MTPRRTPAEAAQARADKAMKRLLDMGVTMTFQPAAAGDGRLGDITQAVSDTYDRLKPRDPMAEPPDYRTPAEVAADCPHPDTGCGCDDTGDDDAMGGAR